MGVKKVFLFGLITMAVGLMSACQPEVASKAAAVSGLRLNHILGEPEDQGFARAEQPRTFNFPVDHGPHNQYRSEWWYLTAVLEDEEGNEYGVHFTLFRQALSPVPTGDGPWHTGQAYLGHLAVTDVFEGEHFEAERFARGHPKLAGVSTEPHFRAHIEDWTFAHSVSKAGLSDPSVIEKREDNGLVLSLQATGQNPHQESFGVDVRIEQTDPVVLQGHRGLSEKGPGSASYYYSIPRMQIAGTLILNDRKVEVTGLGWLDREWSTSVLGDSLDGWDWFSLQLNDERSIMAFRLRRQDGSRDPYDHGLIVNHQQLLQTPLVGEGDPGVQLLTSKDFSLKPIRYFLDANGTSWPVSWNLTIGKEEFFMHALLDEQIVDLSIVYWEGIVEVLDSSGQRLGLGYMELTGY